MPLLTKVLLSEMVLYRLAGGVYDSAFPVQPEDVWKAIEQKVNSIFKLQHFAQTLPSSETIPENLSLATYAGVAVTSYGEKAKATLPVIPISLPRNMGIYMVYDERFPDAPFIPILRGQGALLKADELLNDLMGQIGYETRNNNIVFTKDITLLGISEVTMELVVMDISQYGKTDPLPIPADMEQQIVDDLVAQFAPIVPESGYVNQFTTATQNPKQ